ncbi:hypothetical protein niasHT_040081 [Heterodera trifolii]|uniref:G-protein coupled receptors family 1 profile domain-containing protein n=1 Tax=Heterodera trifolii TaxID=157864 RepID=A0ABD2J2F6_9BILA
MALSLSTALPHVSCNLTVNALHFWQHFLVMAQLTDLLIALFCNGTFTQYRTAARLLHSDCKCFTLLASHFLVMAQLTDLLIALFLQWHFYSVPHVSCNLTVNALHFWQHFLVMAQLTDLLIALFCNGTFTQVRTSLAL